MSGTAINLLDPKVLGLWTRCIREASHWSQEALAASSGLDVRTIQRIEAGKPVNITTRRALARGLGYEKHDVFEDPAFIKFVQHEFLKDIKEIRDDVRQKQYPNHIPLLVTKANSGADLAARLCNSEGHIFNSDEAVCPKAKELAASLFDYLHDLGDIIDEASFSQKLHFNRELDEMLKEIEEFGADCCSALRAAQIGGAGRVNQTPTTFKVGYLVVVPKGKLLTEVMVPRQFS